MCKTCFNTRQIHVVGHAVYMKKQRRCTCYFVGLGNFLFFNLNKFYLSRDNLHPSDLACSLAKPQLHTRLNTDTAGWHRGKITLLLIHGSGDDSRRVSVYLFIYYL